MLTSVLLPVYNGANYIEESIKTILKQRGDWELIIQDDCSTDNTYEVCKPYLSQHVKYFRNNANVKIWATLNNAVSNSKGDLLRIFSHDDNMLADDILICEEYMRQHPDIGISFTDHEKIDGNGVLIGNSSAEVERNKDLPDKMSGSLAAEKLYKWGCISGSQSNITIRRTVYEQMKGFNETMFYAGDFYLLATMGVQYGIGYNRKVTCQIRLHPLQTSSEGRRSAGKISEMRIILFALLEQMDKKTASKYDGYFPALYGYYLIKTPLRQMLRGDFDAIRAFANNFGIIKTIRSVFAALRK